MEIDEICNFMSTIPFFTIQFYCTKKSSSEILPNTLNNMRGSGNDIRVNYSFTLSHFLSIRLNHCMKGTVVSEKTDSDKQRRHITTYAITEVKQRYVNKYPHLLLMISSEDALCSQSSSACRKHMQTGFITVSVGLKPPHQVCDPQPVLQALWVEQLSPWQQLP